MTIIPTMENYRMASKKYETVVFGAGEYCMRFLNTLADDEIDRISFIVDNDKEKQNTKLYGIPVKDPSAISELTPQNTFVVITAANKIPEIYSQINSMGEYTIMSARILINDVFSHVAVELYNNLDKIAEVTNLLYDDKSKRIYNEAIRRRMLFGECDFGDLVSKGDSEYRLPLAYEDERPKDEIIIDCGAYNGDTLRRFSDTFGTRLKKIYAFECMEESLSELAETISHIKNKKYYPEMVMMPYALSDHNCVMKFAKTHKPSGSFLVDYRAFAQNALYESDYTEVEVTTIDKTIPEDEKITLIKMDIEGSEYSALHGAEKLIKRCKPRLAISLYHSGEDYYRIPLYIKSIVPEYKFAVRHHNVNHCDTDLYCWI